MNLDIRGNYILSFLLSVFVAILAADLYLEYALGEWLEAQLVTELRRHAVSGRALIESQAPPLTHEGMDPIANLLGQEPLRFTIIAADGVVLGDSRVNGEQLRGMENHATRPEVLMALQEGWGRSKHDSVSLSKIMLYVAVPFHQPQGSGVVRVAMGIESVQFVQNKLRFFIIVASFISMLAALSLSGLSAQWATRTQRYVIACAQGMASSIHAPRIELHANDALAGLASSLNLLAEEKNETLAQLSAQKSQMVTVLQSMSEGVLALDGQHIITLMNRSVQELLHLPASAIGQTVVSVLPGTAISSLGLEPGRLLEHTFSAEFDLDKGAPRRIMAVVTSLHDQPGHVIVLRDVTEKRRLDQIRRDFVANVSHELRTPVSVLQANAQTLLEGALEDKKYSRVLVEAMDRNAGRLGRIISELLDLSRLEAEQFAMELHEFPLLVVVGEVVELVRRAAQEKQMVVQVQVDPDLVVHADVEVLRRILTNFLDNAIKYTPNQSQITVRTNRYQERLRLEVVDNGPGIAPQHWDRLFERFYRVDSGRSRKVGGTGLGLAIVKHLAENMGEKVGMEGVEPQGSLFWVSLSLAKRRG
ncbi:MAG: PAS domain-containing protein [Magnetococcales bacterium]|nr:PAS domain-containing protein [Magnetococcales bacterium]